ncbi:MAG: hypothetical protein ACOCZX_01140 [Candidatus Bipolaricaulota bacterium]
MIKAVSLFSGSLASVVATELVHREEQVDQVVLITFRSPFFEDYERVKEMAHSLWPDLHYRSQSVKKKCEALSNISSTGSFHLPTTCKGCRQVLLSRGKRFMERVGGDFLVTGEVLDRHGLGREALSQMEDEANLNGLVFRPLSAGLLPPTLPAQRGWVQGQHGIEAGNHAQLERLARSYGIELDGPGFPAEERCKLTSRRYGKRLENLLQEPNFTTNVLKLLEFDRYYKVPPDTKIVLGMTEEEKRELQNYFLPSDLRVYLPSHSGPMTLVRTNWDSKDQGETSNIVNLAAGITVYHSEADHLAKVPVNYRFENDSDTYQDTASPVEESIIRKYTIDSKTLT